MRQALAIKCVSKQSSPQIDTVYVYNIRTLIKYWFSSLMVPLMSVLARIASLTSRSTDRFADDNRLNLKRTVKKKTDHTLAS